MAVVCDSRHRTQGHVGIEGFAPAIFPCFNAFRSARVTFTNRSLDTAKIVASSYSLINRQTNGIVDQQIFHFVDNTMTSQSTSSSANRANRFHSDGHSSRTR